MPRKEKMEVSNSQDVLDSRDVIARLEELRSEREALAHDVEDAAASEPDKGVPEGLAEAQAELAEWDADNGEELTALEALNKEGENYGDWQHGETLIRDSYFKEYAQELAEDTGAIDRNAQWPLMHIDWDAAAADLQSDYADVDFDGVTYWMRA